MLSPAFIQIRDALAQAPFVARIETQDDYERALELMDQLSLGARAPWVEIPLQLRRT